MSIMCIQQYIQYIVTNSIYVTQYILSPISKKNIIINTISNQTLSNNSLPDIYVPPQSSTVTVPITLSPLNKSFTSYYQHIYENNSYYEHDDNDDCNCNCNYIQGNYWNFYRTQDQTKTKKTHEPYPDSLLF